ncbi:MAG: tail fiber domain-containing protein, partial [Candidatus Margulisiibacteriota bacterium]
FGSHARMGVSGEAWDTTGVNYGGIFTSYSTSGYGVYARAKATSGTNYGVYGITNNLSGYGAYGYNSSSATLGYIGSRFYGVYGQYNVSNYGMLGYNSGGVYGYSEAVGGRGGDFQFFGTGGNAVYGYTEDGTSNGVYGTNGNNGNWGYLGGPQVGAYGAYDANNFGYMGDYGRGVHGQTNLTTGYGVYGYNASTANGGTAGYFKGGYYALSSLDLARGILVESRSNSITVEVVREYTIMDGTGDHIGVRALNARAATSGIITAGGYFSTIGGGSGASYGVMGGSSGLTGAGVYGGTSSLNNAAYGVYGEAARTSTYGILGNNLYGVGGTYNNATGPYGWLGTATAGLYAYAASPRWAISSSGRVHMTNLSPAGAGTVLVISATGEVYPQSSSRRYKKDIVDYQIEAAKVSQLRPVRFRWKETTATPNEPDFGLIAEEVNEVFPDLVKLNQNGSPESVSYEKIGIILIKAYQEKEKALASQEAKTLKLEARTEEMARLLLLERTRNDALENRLKAIEATLKK